MLSAKTVANKYSDVKLLDNWTKDEDGDFSAIYTVVEAMVLVSFIPSLKQVLFVYEK